MLLTLVENVLQMALVVVTVDPFIWTCIPATYIVLFRELYVLHLHFEDRLDLLVYFDWLFLNLLAILQIFGWTQTNLMIVSLACTASIIKRNIRLTLQIVLQFLILGLNNSWLFRNNRRFFEYISVLLQVTMRGHWRFHWRLRCGILHLEIVEWLAW